MIKSNTLFKSEKFWTALMVVILMVSISYFPQLEPLEDVILENAVEIIMLFVAYQSIGKVADKWIEKDKNRLFVEQYISKILSKKFSISYKGKDVFIDIPDYMEEDIASELTKLIVGLLDKDEE